MFYPNKITLVKSDDRVLEIGPGASPHPRSDVFLELDFASSDAKIAQRGGGAADGNFGIRPVFYYDGNDFPFRDNEFDYVICSHVVEHVDNPELFMREIFRVGKGCGYIEYPLIPYEYMYSFKVHNSFVKYDFNARTLFYMKKTEYQFQAYAPIHILFYNMLDGGWDDLCVMNKELFFEGFEFDRGFDVKVTTNISQLCPSSSGIVIKSPLRRLILRIMNKLKI